MTLEQSWQHYRSLVNGKLAIFSVNLDILTKFPSETSHKIMQLQFAYEVMDDSELPAHQVYQTLMTHILKVSTQLSALANTLYAGYVFSAGKAQLYFYCGDLEPCLDVLHQFDYIEHIESQDDPHWDIYFDFLLPSPLEMKINATEEVLALLSQNGRDLSDTYVIEHTFYFDDEENMFRFVEQVNIQNIDFVSLQYSNVPIPLEEEEQEKYLVKLAQDMRLDNADIFQVVEECEELANQFGGEYSGWECDAINDKEQLN